MPLWTKTTIPKFQFLSGGKYFKKNVIATNAGWVHRHNYTDTHGVKRKREEILVAIPRLAEKADPFPKPSFLYVANTTGGTSLKKAQLNHLYVSYDEPIKSSNTGVLRITVANTAGGNNCIATANVWASSITNANNTVHFRFKTATAGTYKVQYQTIVNTAAAILTSWNTGNAVANLVINVNASNTLGTFTVV